MQLNVTEKQIWNYINKYLQTKHTAEEIQTVEGIVCIPHPEAQYFMYDYSHRYFRFAVTRTEHIVVLFSEVLEAAKQEARVATCK